MSKFRIVLIDTTTVYGIPVTWYAVQKRVAFFWWITVEYTSQLSQARYWLHLHKTNAPYRKEKVLEVIE
ncbi:hypothetical protein A54_111 [Septuagintavirus sv54]|uniref:Uncharacterized protein n=1 Tax=Escherichia phage A5-4 TaxID=2996162 RepID=A0AAE9PSK6_9CAUD|nr:hypothetical protein A54_111 [Escherichia phage A5-4]